MELIGIVNGGYEITDVTRIGKKFFVIGYNEKAVEQYVTWEATIVEKGITFYWGHYFTSRIEAEHDLWKRAGKQIEYDKNDIPWKLQF